MIHGKLIVACIALTALPAVAQEGAADSDALDLTMVLMPENATLPDAVTRVIALPAAAAEAARENAARGLDAANAARDRESGIENAAEAGEQGRERAQQNREDRGRGAAEGRGGGPPESIGPPDTIGPPDGGPGRGDGPPETPGPPGN
jgi:hypothetical protein